MCPFADAGAEPDRWSEIVTEGHKQWAAELGFILWAPVTPHLILSCWIVFGRLISFAVRCVFHVSLCSQVNHQTWCWSLGCQISAQCSTVAASVLWRFPTPDLFALFWGSDQHHETSISGFRDDFTNHWLMTLSSYVPCVLVLFVEYDNWHDGESEGLGVKQLLWGRALQDFCVVWPGEHSCRRIWFPHL